MIALTRFWILLSALLVSAGWVLSAVHQLNRLGYLVTLALAGAAALFFCRSNFPAGNNVSRLLYKLRRRFKRPLPLLFLALAAISLAGGLLYNPTDVDGLEYRTPRILHWLGQQQWHWIQTTDYRMNIAGTGFEWLGAPLILFTRADHYLFLINWFSYLLLPGLTFGVFIRMGVSRRLAWWWMWLAASGWCFVFEAGSTVNDSLAAVYALAAIELALRARENNAVGDLWLSLLGAALATGVKQTDIPLGVLWLAAAWPCRKMLFRHPLAGIVTGSAAALVSFLPITLINLRETGTWLGIPKDSVLKTSLHSPWWGIAGNSFCLSVQNLLPPFFPWGDRWNAAMHEFLRTPLGLHFSDFEDFGHISLIQAEGNAGIGLGILLLMIISLVAARGARRFPGATPTVTALPIDRHKKFLRLIPWLLLLIFMAKVGTFQNARQLAPYYLLLIPALLTIKGVATLPRRRWWRQGAAAVMVATVLMAGVSRARPMFPAQTLLAKLMAKRPDSKWVAALANSYNYRASLESVRIYCRKSLPRDGSTLGYLAGFGGAAEPAMWFPWGGSTVQRILPDATRAEVSQAGIQWVLVDDSILNARSETIDSWALRLDARLVDHFSYSLNPRGTPENLYILRLNQ